MSRWISLVEVFYFCKLYIQKIFIINIIELIILVIILIDNKKIKIVERSFRRIFYKIKEKNSNDNWMLN